MDTLFHRFSGLVKGVIKGFDRIVFKGHIRPIMYAAGMQLFLKTQGILNKDYKDWVKTQSTAIIEVARQYSQNQCGCDIKYISSCNERKEELAHEQQRKTGIKKGLIGIWSCVEACSTYHAIFDPFKRYPRIESKNSRCKHLYFYYDHCDYGFMSVRLQTWAPYNIQVAINGREWLRRMLDKEGCKYILNGNKFLYIDDYELAQRLLDSQLDTDWGKMLDQFVPVVFPDMPKILGDGIGYYWTMWQSERAKDYIFESPDVLSLHMNDFLRHAFITGTSDRVLRYMGRPVTEEGQPHPLSKPELFTRVNLWHDGARIRHWVDNNSVKLYNEQNVLRFEMTMNAPEKYRVYRHIQGDDKSKPKKLLPMRKGIADINLRAKISDDRINSFTEHMATLEDKTPVYELIASVSHSFSANGKRIRSLDVTGKDRELLQAISDPMFNVNFITNKALQQKLISTQWAKDMSGKKLSSRISRHLRLLRDHGLIKKLPNQRKYNLTEKGRKLTSALNAALSASTSDLLKMSA